MKKLLQEARVTLEATPTPAELSAKATGNCYGEAAEELLFGGQPKSAVLVHGRPTLQVPPYIEFGHAWIEVGDKVIDVTTGFKGPREIYYMIGKINPKDNLVYTAEEAKQWLMAYQHYGPWEGVDASPPEDPMEYNRFIRSMGKPKRSKKSKPIRGMEDFMALFKDASCKL